MKCRYCGNDSRFVDNIEIYGRRYGQSYMAWWCEDCDAHIGVHLNDPLRPLGENLANKELRQKKMKVKALFIKKLLNGSWDCPKRQKGSAYRRLADGMGIDVNDCHFGNFEMEDLQCAQDFLTNLQKMTNQLTAYDQKRQNELLKNGDGMACYMFAIYVKGSDYKKLMARYNELINNEF